MTQEIKALHQSSTNTALRCGEQFRRRYVEGEIIPPSIAAGRGTGVHKGNDANLKQKIQSKEDLPLSDIKDATRDGFLFAFRNGVYVPREERSATKRLLNEGLNDALRCAEVYTEQVAPKIQPIAVEQKFLIKVQDLPLPLAGTMDYQEKPLVGDIKTSTRTWAKDREKKEIQPIFYSLVHENEKGVRPTFRYDVLIARRGKNGPTSTDYQELTVNPTDNDYMALFFKLRLVCDMIEKGIFVPANPTSWWCDEKWCGYWHTCPYVGNEPLKKWV